MAMLVRVMRSSSVSEAMPSPAKYIAAIGRAVDADLADDGEDQILGGQVRRDLAVEGELHRRRDFEPGFAGAQREGGIGVADAGGELAERAGGAGVASRCRAGSRPGRTWPSSGSALWQTPL